MRSPITWGAAVALACGLAPAAFGQGDALPGAAPAATATAATPGAAATATAAAPQRNLWTFLCPPQELKDKCKEKFCNSMFGQMFNNGLKPASALTGGVIPGCCPPVKKSDLLKPADSAEGAAARIKEDEANAKARRAAVRYLGTVDCRYWPEARDALINSLRADRNECVRLEAAHSLGRGCCCNKATMQALIWTVTGSDADGNPQEPSERVRIAAEYALRRCLDCYVEVERVKPAEKKAPEKLGPPTKEEEEVVPFVKPKTGGEKVGQKGDKSWDQLLAEARKALANRPTVTSVPPPGADVEGHSLASIWNNAMAVQSASKPVNGVEPARLPLPVETRPTTVVVNTPPQQAARPRGIVGRVFERTPSRSSSTVSPAVPERVILSETEVVSTGPALPPAPMPQAVTAVPAGKAPAPAAFVPPAVPTATPVVPAVSQAPAGTKPPVLTLMDAPAKPREVPTTVKAPLTPAAEPVKATPRKPETTVPVTKAAETSAPARTSPAATMPVVSPVSLAPTSMPLPAGKPAAPVATKVPAATKAPVLALEEAPAKRLELPPAPLTPPPPPAAKVTLAPPAPAAAPVAPAVKETAVKAELTRVVKKDVEPTTPARAMAAPVTTPVAAPVSQATAKAPAAAPVTQSRWQEAVRPSVPAMSKEELLAVYRGSVEPSRREWAAEQLGGAEGAGTDERVVQALLAGANSDPAPMVRVACLNSIHRLHIMDYQLAGILQRLKADGDVRVKQTAQAVDRWLQDEAARCVSRPATKVR